VSIQLQPLDDPALRAAFAAGLAKAARSCGELSGGRLVVTTSEVRRLSAEDVLISAGGPEVPVAAVYVGFTGLLNGHAVLMLPAEEARGLARIVLDRLGEGAADEVPALEMAGMTPLERSALEETANIAVSAVLSGLGDHIGDAIHPSVPMFVYDMAGAVLDAIVSGVADRDEMLVAARTRFSQDGREASGVLLVVPAAQG
jgi:chemotaxis protein CheY-P-specific phosphatase CheC